MKTKVFLVAAMIAAIAPSLSITSLQALDSSTIYARGEGGGGRGGGFVGGGGGNRGGVEFNQGNRGERVEGYDRDYNRELNDQPNWNGVYYNEGYYQEAAPIVYPNDSYYDDGLGYGEVYQYNQNGSGYGVDYQYYQNGYQNQDQRQGYQNGNQNQGQRGNQGNVPPRQGNNQGYQNQGPRGGSGNGGSQAGNVSGNSRGR